MILVDFTGVESLVICYCADISYRCSFQKNEANVCKISQNYSCTKVNRYSHSPVFLWPISQPNWVQPRIWNVGPNDICSKSNKWSQIKDKSIDSPLWCWWWRMFLRHSRTINRLLTSSFRIIIMVRDHFLL